MAYSENVEEIYVEPPEVSSLTDEDSGDEDSGGTLDNLSGRQLRSHAELVLSNNNRISCQEDIVRQEQSNSDVDETPEQHTEKITNKNTGIKKTKSKKFEKAKEIIWDREGDLEQSTARVFPDHSKDYKQLQDLSCVDIFEKFITDDVIDLLVAESTKYALFKNCNDPKITADEIRCFIAILIVSGYDQKPGKRMFWDSANDMRNYAVTESMRRNRFEEILKFLHCADNTKMDASDKMYKLRPFMNILKQNFLTNFVPVENLDYDESMVKYFGRHGCKQFIRGKPIRFGFKIWSMNSKDGYLINFDVYQGKQLNAVPEREKMFGKAAAPLINMIDELPKKQYPYKFHLDNLFTSTNIFIFMQENGYGCTGTFREDRLGKCPLVSKKDLKKKERGTIEQALDKNNGIIFVKWVDNNVVTVGSNCYGVKPLNYVKRYSKAEKKYVNVPRPDLIGRYNSNMGGTDLMDENINTYRIDIRSKKWWWCIFTWCLDAAISNAWILYRKGCNQRMTQLTFRRTIAQTYLRRYGTIGKGAGRPSTSKFSISFNRVSDDMRYDETNHLLVYIADKKRRRCAGEGCSTSARTMCRKCDVGLCLDCNYIFHTKTK